MLLNLFLNQKEWKDFSISNKKNIYADENLWSYIIAGLYSHTRIPTLVITSSGDKNLELLDDFNCISDRKYFMDFPPAGEGIFLKNKPADAGKVSQRLSVIKRILNFKEKNDPFVTVASAASIINLMSSGNLSDFSEIRLEKGKDYNREELIRDITELGYERVSKVFDKGEFSVRGDIIDVFDLSSVNPVRFDFFDNTLEKIIFFDISNYAGLYEADNYEISPNNEPWKIGSLTPDEDTGPQQYYSLPDLFGRFVGEFNLVICEPVEVYLKLKSERDLIEKSLNIRKDELLLQDIDLIRNFLIPGDFFENSSFDFKYNLNSGNPCDPLGEYFEFSRIKSQSRNFSNPGSFLENIKKDISLKRNVFISLDNNERIKKISELFSENNLSFKTTEELGENTDDFRIISLSAKRLLRGFRSGNISLYGELDIYEQLDRRSDEIYEIKAKGFNQFNPGDFVVHKSHGIGKYIDIVSETSDGVKKDYFLIEYARGDKLYVPTWQAERIHRYIGDSEPVVTSLNSKQWDSLKTKVRKSVKTLAFDLARLYAQREAAEGFSFQPDSPWQKEIEDLFPFNETRDQLDAINTVKEKMQEARPMDILLCGDVGFGKTEVAIRAAFKAAENGKQVLMLVPTTILADQHFNTFKSRFRNYPVIVDVISRFRKKAVQKEIISRFNAGQIDILIGTHRILGNDIQPKDLGLIIVDEEQRFGVNAKEKLKLLKKQVDVLTMTATPIPRTLYMSLIGIKDIVLIETYPENRHPIKTFVGRRNNLIIKNAIEREMQRGGQIYYVSNRIIGIDHLAFELKKLVPSARIAITHGRLEGRKIEKLMEDFINKKYDILLTTSIIESGMDIINVNTLIVENAQRFGLSQLYQLRGRVGRSSERAFAYFFYTERDSLTFNALERLKALEEFNALGSGYNIALKDLEIRGAGELLGANQHGHMSSVGFDLYCEIIREEIEALKGNEPEKENNVLIDLPVSAYIPKNYIKNENERINLYKGLSEAKNMEELDFLSEKVNERFGELPDVMKNLFNISRIKILLREKSVEKVRYVAKKGILIKPVITSREKALRLNRKNKNISYNFKEKSIIINFLDSKSDTGKLFEILKDITNNI
jgi:transcription-repair coupling factor (superfamily II helicase)